MLQKLIVAGFQVDFRSHARAILELDFPEVESQLEEVLLASTIPIEEIIGSGGGETKGTQRLRNAQLLDFCRILAKTDDTGRQSDKYKGARVCSTLFRLRDSTNF
jgi:hypothetical protein